MSYAPVRWGIVSTAHINRLVIPGAHASPQVALAAVASRDGARAEEYAHKWEVPVAYGSYEGLLAAPTIEAVYISLPNTLHCEWSIRAVEAGKHVLCEKPLSRHPDEVVAAFDAADRAGRLLSEAFMFRHNPQTARVVSLVQSGAGGELRLRRPGVPALAWARVEPHPRHPGRGGGVVDGGRCLVWG